ncbi:FHA domain-containing protein DDL [Citrus sinensis]|uniref:FHA domain-containing protein DDL isoform X1 n=1 Tax=Citrus sinensis TaxID=2711 RepID=UPI0003D6FA69|nr:FHA domain-containing protein DDL isoform X1 [Citrus sinensis]XP_024034287.1 FHA domain-containing protein DDL isoform X1 [Citrus x clementina]XP_024034288.1 FHA domain-containing protein DDL isoform X1 [Citrus x clementina]XP_024034289.1 FHA domain-containing protein DDL isoform X1 [Citrus x clementina]XP_024949523.1 FHA domain-containing protein DDL isoform X1 [Citrus sinensis]KAH9651517.1 FHA domain-containing protein DDL [Citrus sinensis]
MGRNLSNHSESPVRDQGGSSRRRSLSRKSPSRRERSPVLHRSSHRGSSPAREKERHSSRAKSPKRAQSQSPVSRSPSPRTRRLMRSRDERELGKVTEREQERNHSRKSDRGTHIGKSSSPSPRTRRLARARDEGDAERVTERDHERNNGRENGKGKLGERTRSPVSRSPSPRTKRLRRAHAEKDADKLTEKEHERNHSRTSDKEAHLPVSRSPSPHTKRLRRADAKVTERERENDHSRASDKDIHRERVSERETGSERKERRERDFEGDREGRKLGRNEASNQSSRSRRDRSTSPLDRPPRSRHRSPQSADGSWARHEVMNSGGAEYSRNDDIDSVAQMKAAEEALQAKEKQKPSFELSGKLAAETNRFRGVTLLFNEPPDARKPSVRWRLYVFKAGEMLKEPLYIHRQSCYLFGRERRVADIPTDHPSCSKQHAVIQFRQVEKEQPDGMLSKEVRPYIMDLGSTNKTYLNDNPIEPQRYYELFEKDTIKFGNSSREYVLLHENSND